MFLSDLVYWVGGVLLVIEDGEDLSEGDLYFEGSEDEFGLLYLILVIEYVLHETEVYKL